MSAGLSVHVEQEPNGRWVARSPGKPEMAVTGDTAPDALHAFALQLERRQAAERFGVAMERLQEQAQRSGVQLTDEEIEAEIRAARSERRSPPR